MEKLMELKKLAKNFIEEEDAVGVVEIILILLVLIGLVILFKEQLTDLVKNILSKEGWFTPSFQTEKQLKDLLENLYSKINLHTEGSMVYFECIK